MITRDHCSRSCFIIAIHRPGQGWGDYPAKQYSRRTHDGALALVERLCSRHASLIPADRLTHDLADYAIRSARPD